MSRMTELYADITDKVKAMLNEGVIPWRKAWRTGIPRNYVTNRVYRGINFLNLSLNDFPSPFYISFLQCKEKEGQILKGSKSTQVVFWKVAPYSNETEAEIETRTSLIWRFYNVFNLSQTSLYNESENQPIILECEELLHSMEEQPVIKHNISRCCYNKMEDYITIPVISDFYTAGEYYSSLFHELIHWTGHKSRLNRFSFYTDNDDKGIEELTAEIGGSYLCSLCGIESAVLENQASYISGWLKLIEDKENALRIALKQSQTAVDFIISNNPLLYPAEKHEHLSHA